MLRVDSQLFISLLMLESPKPDVFLLYSFMPYPSTRFSQPHESGSQVTVPCPALHLLTYVTAVPSPHPGKMKVTSLHCGSSLSLCLTHQGESWGKTFHLLLAPPLHATATPKLVIEDELPSASASLFPVTLTYGPGVLLGIAKTLEVEPCTPSLDAPDTDILEPSQSHQY